MRAKTVICFGDSNTHGFNSENMGRFTEKERWTCRLSDLLGDGYLVREEGLGGRTTCFNDPLTEGLSGLDYLYPCLMTHEPVDLLIIMLGTNDVKERFAATPGNIAKALERLVTKAIRTTEAWHEGKPHVLLVAPPPIEPGYEKAVFADEMGKGCVEKSRALAPLFKELADRLDCWFLDAATVEGVKMCPSDYMHLNRTAHRRLAEALAELVPQII